MTIQIFYPNDTRFCRSWEEALEAISRVEASQRVHIKHHPNTDPQVVVDVLSDTNLLFKEVRAAKLNTLLNDAHLAGLKAGNEVVPVPMVVSGGYAPIADGLCGFAWVTIKGIGPLAKHVKSIMTRDPRSGWSKGYPSGLTLWVHEFNQSITRKEAYAYAFAQVLRAAGFSAVSGSRLD